MNEKTYVPVMSWTVEARNESVAVLTSEDGRELRIRITPPERYWLIRGRHPAYASRLRTELEDFVRPDLRLELRDSGDGSVVAFAIGDVADGQRQAPVSMALTLLMTEFMRIPLSVEEALFANEAAVDQIINAFAAFIDTASIEDFARTAP